MKMRSLLVAAASAAVVAIAAPAALAADLPAYEPSPEYAAPSQSFTWTGGYVGAQAGYGWGKSTNKGRGPNTHPDGAVVGGFAGYNQQFDGSPVVVGVETDLNYNDTDAKRQMAGGHIKNELNWSGATRGRVGYAFDRVLVYGAGGVAYGGEKVSRRTGPVSGSDSKTALGYTVGAGVEGAVTDNIVARVDYRYNDYGSDKYKVGGGKVKSDLTENRVMGGVAYKFGGF